jgi:hypothetical protein
MGSRGSWADEVNGLAMAAASLSLLFMMNEIVNSLWATLIRFSYDCMHVTFKFVVVDGDLSAIS